ncbi:MAG: hemerythrin domain-containing protein [Deltaproteobacteria bacterium]|nr:hemerythrin domain-containing protein [Deltaproteobacteria bacterium]
MNRSAEFVDPTSLHRTLQLLRDLQEEASTHYRGEEEPDGLFEELRTRSPENIGRVDALQEQHGQLLAGLQQLLDRYEEIQQILDGLNQQTTSLLQTMEQHEREEAALVMDAYYLDLGGAG